MDELELYYPCPKPPGDRDVSIDVGGWMDAFESTGIKAVEANIAFVTVDATDVRDNFRNQQSELENDIAARNWPSGRGLQARSGDGGTRLILRRDF